MLKSTRIRRHYLAMGKECITDQANWTRLVKDVLTREGIVPITETHNVVMDCVRKYYLERKRAPSVREICKETDLSLEQFFSLFNDWAHTLYIIDGIVCGVLNIPQWHIEQC